MSWSGIVRLTSEDLALAEACAQDMLRDSRKKGMRDRFGKDSAESHRNGALGEIALARYLGVPWRCHPGDTNGATDILGYEVRAIPSTQPWVYIKAKENDKDDTRVVLVLLLHRDTAALIVGWMLARDIRAAVKASDPGARGAQAWMLSDLRPLNRSFPERSQ